MTRWLTRAELAEKLSTHPNSIYRFEQKPGFPERSQILGAPRWREDEIDLYMESGRSRGGHFGVTVDHQGRELVACDLEEGGHDS
jgi:predicted DNA-binding transcriptional regulator AlpA